MGFGRERYNAKARGSTPGKNRKKGKRNPRQDEGEDSNPLLLLSKSRETKEAERRERIRHELALATESKMNNKKKRRLEKYIDKKIQQEERVVIFEKLAQSQALSNSTKLQASSSLGSGRPFTHEERFARLEDKETRRALDGTANGKKKRKRGHASAGGAADIEDVTSQSEEFDGGVMEERSNDAGVRIVPPSHEVIDVTNNPVTASIPSSSAVGSALQRNPDGTVVPPRVVKRKPKTNTRLFSQKWNKSIQDRYAPVSYEDISSSSFDSSDSAYDSSRDSSLEIGGELDDEEWTGFTGHMQDDQDAEETQDIVVQQSVMSDSAIGDHSTLSEAETMPKAAGFKEWALKQLEIAKGYQPLSSPSAPPSASASTPQHVPRSHPVPQIPDPVRGPLGEVLSLPATSFAQHVRSQDPMHASHAAISTILSVKKNVSVDRPEAIQAARLLLPIVAEEQPIMETILLNPIVIICGETGSGKTTQVPQFLYEAGFGSPGGHNPGMIGITQPRRVAAMSMAARVATELSLPSSRVSYQIRYDATVSPTTSIKFMTDGVLLRELATDFLLSRYSVVVVDEAHERSMNTDVLIGVLSRVVRLREEMWTSGKDDAKPLRLIIMSATLRVSDFTSNTTLFRMPPPVINIPARQHPVTIHFSRRTVPDYVTEAVRKITKIHARLPPGGILVFLTGQNEIKGVCKKLETRFGRTAIREKKMRQRGQASRPPGRNRQNENQEEQQSNIVPTQVDVEPEDMNLGGDTDELAMDVDGDVDPKGNADALDSDPEASDDDLVIDTDDSDIPMHVVPLYSLLSSENQLKVFRTPPPDTRLVVVATNVAETSLTIPGIRYVVDCGRAKERKYVINSGIQSFQVSWISKASAAQRAGRAGRTGPGHCYRLYSSALFEHHFADFAQPEILRVPIEGVVLQMKNMNIDAVVNFPFPTPPDRPSLKRAEITLGHLGALEDALSGSHITDLGRTMALFPVSPRFSKMLVAGKQHGCLPFVIAIVSALSVGDPFLREEALAVADEDSGISDTIVPDIIPELSHIDSRALKDKEAGKARRRAFFISQRTHASLGNASSDVFRMLSVVGAYEYAQGGHAFCEEQFVRAKAMEEIHKLRAQISKIVHANFPDIVEGFVPKIRPPNELQLKILRQLLTAGLIDQVAIRKDIVDKSITSGNKYASSRGVRYKALGISEDVFIHPSSVLYHIPPPGYVVFHEIVRTSRPWIKTLTVVNPVWLPKLGPALCSLAKLTRSSEGDTIVIPRFGPDAWELPPIRTRLIKQCS